MQPTHWQITVERPQGWKRPAKPQHYWGVPLPAAFRDVWFGNRSTGVYRGPKRPPLVKYKAYAEQHGLIVSEITAWAFIELTPEQLADNDLPIPAEAEWDLVTARYAKEWWPTMEEHAPV